MPRRVRISGARAPGQGEQHRADVVGVGGAVHGAALPADQADPGAVLAPAVRLQEPPAVLRSVEAIPAQQVGVGEGIDLPRLHARALEQLGAVAAVQVQRLHRAAVRTVQPGAGPERQGPAEQPGADLVEADGGGQGRPSASGRRTLAVALAAVKAARLTGERTGRNQPAPPGGRRSLRRLPHGPVRRRHHRGWSRRVQRGDPRRPARA